MRRWTIVSWLFLGIGILLGAKWAYETLGWGGYWAWDPVENAAFMPWLVATAFLHSVMVQERRGMLKVWNMVLVILTFCLCLFGTFLTRSGIISSVHAFGESTLGPFFLALHRRRRWWARWPCSSRRLPLLRSQHSLESYLSREAIFLFNNLLLVGLAFAVFWGTIFPILSEAVRGERITVGQGYYDQVAMPIGIALLVLTGVGPLIAWRKASPAQLRRRFVAPSSSRLLSAIPLLLFTGPRAEPAPRLAVVVAGVFVTACIAGEFWRGTARAPRARGASRGRGPSSAWSPATAAATAATSSTWASSSCSSAWPAPRASPPRPTSRCATGRARAGGRLHPRQRGLDAARRTPTR